MKGNPRINFLCSVGIINYLCCEIYFFFVVFFVLLKFSVFHNFKRKSEFIRGGTYNYRFDCRWLLDIVCYKLSFCFKPKPGKQTKWLDKQNKTKKKRKKTQKCNENKEEEDTVTDTDMDMGLLYRDMDKRVHSAIHSFKTNSIQPKREHSC